LRDHAISPDLAEYLIDSSGCDTRKKSRPGKVLLRAISAREQYQEEAKETLEWGAYYAPK
jgi:hypothetical protein